MTLLPDHPRHSHAVVIGAGTMGADVAIVLARGNCRITVTDPEATRRERLAEHVRQGLEPLGLAHRAAQVHAVASLDEVERPAGYDDAMVTVWEDGRLLRDWTFAEIRAHADAARL